MALFRDYNQSTDDAVSEQYINDNSKKITIIGEFHGDIAARKYILENIRSGVYTSGTVIALENVRTRRAFDQVNPKMLRYHLAGLHENEEYSLANIITEASEQGIFVTSIEDPCRAIRYDAGDGDSVKKRLKIVNEYAKDTIKYFIEQEDTSQIVVLCGIAHLDSGLSEHGVKGIREYFDNAESHIMTDETYNGIIPNGIKATSLQSKKGGCVLS